MWGIPNYTQAQQQFLGGTIGALGGLFQNQNLRNLGGQMTGGVRNFNIVPVAKAAEQVNWGPSQENSPWNQQFQNRSGGNAQGNVLGAASNPNQPNVSNPSSDQNAPRAQNQMGSQEDLMNQVNQAYGGVFDVLGQREQALQAGKPAYLEAAQAPYEAMRPDIEKALQQGTNLNKQQVSGEQTRQANALSSAEQLFNELQQGVRQRFGGIGSPAEFANAFYGRQLQQNEGNILNQGGQNFAQLQTALQNLNVQHDQNTKQLDLQKASALADAQKTFQDRLDQIAAMKGQAAENKAGLQLQALQQLRTNAQSIENNYTSFLQNLQSQHAAADLNLRNMITQYGVLAGNPQVLSQYPSLRYNMVNQPQSAGFAAPAFTAPTGNVQRDQFGNPLQ